MLETKFWHVIMRNRSEMLIFLREMNKGSMPVKIIQA